MTMTKAQATAGIPKASMPIVEKWLARGDGIAVYENAELGHPGLGDRQWVSYGGPQAQIELDEPPVKMPDISGAINWRFQLVGTYREGRGD